MTEHPNASLYREAFAKLVDKDVDFLIDTLHDDVVWWQIGATEPLRGKAAVAASLDWLRQLDFDVELHDVVANDDHTVALVSATVRLEDFAFSYRTAEILHIEGGRITERWAFSDDTENIKRFFARFGPS